MPKTIHLTFHNDPGHAWLEVSMVLLRQLKIDKQITRYSYRSGHHAYLEEDGDYSTFKRAAEAAGYTLNITEKYADSPSPIRALPHYYT